MDGIVRGFNLKFWPIKAFFCDFFSSSAPRHINSLLFYPIVSNMSIISSTQTIAEDGISIAINDSLTLSNHRDDDTLVSSIDIMSRQENDIQWIPQSSFLRFNNTSTFPPSAPLVYVDGDPEADWAGAEGGANESFIGNFFHFITSKIRSFFERLARMTFVTACL